jgi:ribosomal-protein-alanine N-acetyltransferase
MLHIRWMLKRDIPQIINIYSSNGGTLYADDIGRYLHENNCIGMVAELNNEPIGFVIYELHVQSSYDKIAHCRSLITQSTNFDHDSIKTCEIQKYSGIIITMYGIFIDYENRFTEIIDYIKNKLTNKRPILDVYIKESELSKQLALQKQGFVAIDIIQQYYGDSMEDAYVMRYAIDV